MARTITAVLEIGTTNTVVLIGETLEGGRARVRGKGVARTTGVRKGQILERKQAYASFTSALSQAEDAADVSVGELMLAVSGAHIVATPGEGRLPVRAVNGKVTRDDLDEIRELARASQPGPDRAILHTLAQHYRLDDLDGISNPEGLSGKQLRLGILFIHGQKDRIEDAVNMLKDRAIDTPVVAFSAVAAATAVLTPEQRNQGVLLIDLGGGTTNYVLYRQNIVVTAGSLNVGGDHITNDIGHAFSLPVNKAEELKLSDGCAIIDPQRMMRRIDLPASVVAQAARSISAKALHAVIEARMRETLTLVRDQIGPDMRQAASGVVFTGGGAYLPQLDELAARVFGMRSVVGEPLPQYIEGLRDDHARPAMLATVAGLLIRSAQETDTSLGLVGALVGKWKKGLGR